MPLSLDDQVLEAADPEESLDIVRSTNGPRGPYIYSSPRAYVSHHSMMSIDLSTEAALNAPREYRLRQDALPNLCFLAAVCSSRTPNNVSLLEAERTNDAQALNQEFRRQRKEGHDWTVIATSRTGKGLYLEARHDIVVSSAEPFRLCEYSGTRIAIPPLERIADVPSRDLMYGVDATPTPDLHSAQFVDPLRWRIVATHPLDNIARYCNASGMTYPPMHVLCLGKTIRYGWKSYPPFAKERRS
jgi:hypothetical protein